ncbi:MAG: MoxR family ATPase [Lachnospiraceae bacterium]|nr:MoxR family ATPase [Lachnospiraceae bacterium]
MVYQGKIEQLQAAINKVFVGKAEIVDKILICLLAGGHVLLEDVPGVGKTTLANTLAKSMQCSFGRIQFTPDTLPGDIVGMSVFNMKTGEFQHRDGVVMNQILLADEINRTSPKTQAALLEAMAEGQVTVDGEVYPLPQPFMVIATQNPVEFLGTYPLPEAQMDRFMMRLSIGYASKEEELKLAQLFLQGQTPDKVEEVCSSSDIVAMKAEVEQIKVNDLVLGYIQDLIQLTRNEERFVLGASPRAMLSLIRASQAKAYICGRDFVKPDDVKQIASDVLLHRVALTSEARIRKEDSKKILQSLIVKARIPV